MSYGNRQNGSATLTPSREIAYRILFDVLVNGAYANISINKNMGQTIKNPQDRALVVNIVYGTIKKRNRLIKVIDKLSNKPYEKLDDQTKVILLMSLYQLYYLEKVPSYAVVNEAVNMCRFYKVASAASFTNAILRNALRQKATLLEGEEKLAEHMYYEYNIDPYVTGLLTRQYSVSWLKDYARNAQEGSDTFIRVNTLKKTEDELIKSLEDEGIKAERTFVPGSLRISKGSDIFSGKAYKEGLFFAQDLSGAISSYFPGNICEESLNILDMCAAPGSKSFNLAMRSPGSTVLSCDISEKKLRLLTGTSKLLGIRNLSVRKNDASRFREEFHEQFDLVICDVPCSGLGVVKRKPEILFGLSEDRFKELYDLQGKILRSGIDALKSGGMLIYSTCTVNKLENEAQIKKLLDEREDVKLQRVELPFSLKTEHPELKKGYLSLDPVKDGCDGFFMARLIKK